MSAASLARRDRRMLVGTLLGLGLRAMRPGVLAAQRIELLREPVEVAEVAVDRREADVGHLIERAQLWQHALADLARRDLRQAELADLALDLERQRRHLIARHRPLRDRGLHTVNDLVAIERLAPVVALDHKWHRLLDALVRREAPLAALA